LRPFALHRRLRTCGRLLAGNQSRLPAATPYRVSQAEAETANQHKSEKDEQQRPRAQRELSIGAGLVLLKFLVVKYSPHAPS
jgi:hypothetical protein